MTYRNFVITFCYAILFWTCHSNEPRPLTIATAANMQYAMTALTEAFIQETGIACEMVVSSSGKLTAQIQAGAPYDILVSADLKYPKVLYEAGLTQNTPDVYAKGQLVLWTMDTDEAPSLTMLTHPPIQHIALANPKIAPYGIAAQEVLQQAGIRDSLSQKLVFGESIAQVNQFVRSEAADIGFTAKSVVLSPNIKGKGEWVAIDTSLHSPILQGIVLLKADAARLEAARQFKEFLFSPKGKEILTTFGYL